MLGFFERQRLVRKGLASSKIRRRRTESEWAETLEHGLAARLGVMGAFALGLALLVWREPQEMPMRQVLFALLIFAAALAQVWVAHPRTFGSNSRLLLLLGICLLHLVLVKNVLGLAESQVASAGVMEGLQWHLLWKLFAPLAFAPLALSVLLGRGHGLLAAMFVTLWGALAFPHHDAVFTVMSLGVGFTAVFATLSARRWTQLLRAGLLVGLATWGLALVFGLIGPVVLEDLRDTHWRLVGWQSAVAVGGGVLTALLAVLTVALLQNPFRVTTDIAWLELTDLNHPLLRRLTLEAPGTYHHSLVVANLAEAGAEAIGANATMCRVCSYFHDIGKLVKPDYFTENMRRDRNPHDELAPTMSALVIIAHVKEGVDLALKANLNQQIIDVIQQHHGTSLVWYFYKRAQQHQVDALADGKIKNIREEDVPEVREESFRYPGPRPETRECAIISLADSIESASRSLEKVTPQKIDQLVDDIIGKRLLDGQLKDCDLTMRELEEVGESFKHTLRSMMHSRVAYPDQRTEKPDTISPGSRVQAPPPPQRPPMTAA
jgi:putative nucleotidyltransferase with HDIG domain